MTRLEKLKVFKEKGWTYDEKTGIITNTRGNICNSISKSGYIQCATWHNGKNIYVQAHQLAFYMSNGFEAPNMIDHINGNKIDNRIENLRAVTNQQNMFNIKNVKGYNYDKLRNKWMSKIKLNYKTIFLGRFDTEEEARQAYLDAKEKYHIIRN